MAVVTASGIVQSRCGRRIDGKPPTACPAWRLSLAWDVGVATLLCLRKRPGARAALGIIALEASGQPRPLSGTGCDAHGDTW